MARGRLICGTLSTSQKYAALHTQLPKLAEFCQALFPLLIAHTDDFGRLQGDEFTVKHQVMPTSPRSLADFTRALTALHTVGMVRWYVADGRKYLQIVDFDSHQSGLHKRTASRFPDNPNDSGNFRELPGGPRNTPEIPSEEKGIELNGTEGKRTRAPRAATKNPPDGFNDFWTAYPRKDAKRDALKAWQQIRPDHDTRTLILADVARRALSDEWTTAGGRFIPLPASYLRGLRWADEGVRVDQSQERQTHTRWDAICDAVETSGLINRHNRHAWLSPCVQVSETPGELVVQVSPSAAPWIEKHYRAALEGALSELVPGCKLRLTKRASNVAPDRRTDTNGDEAHMTTRQAS